jgi:ADP-heptose:LPS heptosyltransferase
MASATKNSQFAISLFRHTRALKYVFLIILPAILRTGRRPVIFSRYSGMGDIICTIPAARELMKRHPGTFFIYNCHADYAPVPQLAGIADLVTAIEPIGYVGYWYGFLLAGFYHFSHGDDLPDSGCQEPMVTEFLRQFDLPLSEEHPELPIVPAAREKALAVFAEKGLETSRLVLIHPGPSWPVREWPREKWAQLVAALRRHGLTHVAQMGTGRHLNFGQVAVESIPGTTSLVNEFSIEECIAAIAQAKLFIGIDSGLLHIAAGTRTPSVGLFGMTLPETRFSRDFRKDFVTNRIECAGCEHRKPRLHWITGCPYEIKCMKTLSVDDVLQACLRKLPVEDRKNNPFPSALK